MEKYSKKINILIVGLGVIGGSFAYGLKKLNYHNIYGVDINTDTIKKAIDMKILKDGSSNIDDFIGMMDLIIIALYPKNVEKVIKENIDKIKKGATITDVTGIKVSIIKKIMPYLNENFDFIFGHPMAGREKKGFDFATETVFKNANYLLIPTSQNKKENLDKFKNLIYDLGFGNINEITPKKHDEMVSYTSQLTHAIAVALVNSDKKNRETRKFVGDSYRDLTRISKINEKLWSELFLDNKEFLLESINLFEAELDKIKDALKNNDENTLKKLFIKSTKRRELMDVVK